MLFEKVTIFVIFSIPRISTTNCFNFLTFKLLYKESMNFLFYTWMIYSKGKATEF